MDLQTAIKGMLDAENSLRTRAGTSDPMTMSEGMMRLSQYAGAVEEHLAECERAYEINWSITYTKNFKEMSTTAADKATKVEMAEEKGNIDYLKRMVGSAWRQVGVVQSRYNHLKEGKAGSI